jgi:peptide/nickel transport system permease protein
MSTAQSTQEVVQPSPQVAAGARAMAKASKPRTFWSMAWRRFRQNKLSMVGLGVVVIMVTLALGAGLISEHITKKTYYEQTLAAKFTPIGENGYYLGADDLGRDVLTRLLYGARISLGVAALSMLAAIAIGATIGVIAGFYGHWVDGLLMRFVDIMLSIPTLFLLLLVVTLWRLGPWQLAFVIAAVSWVTLSRLIRGEVMSVKNRDFVEAARLLGASNGRIMFRHILPNVMPVLIVWASLTVPALILVEASLSYLGLGVQPPDPSWGNMLTSAQRVWSHAPTLVLLPGLAIYITVFAINLVGGGLRDALDPRLTN